MRGTPGFEGKGFPRGTYRICVESSALIAPLYLLPSFAKPAMRRFRDGPAHSPTAARIDDYDAPRTTAPTHCTIPQPLSALAERPHPRMRATRRIAHMELFARRAGKISTSRARCAHGSNGRSIFSTTLSRVVFQEFILPCISIHLHIPCYQQTSRTAFPYSHSPLAITLLVPSQQACLPNSPLPTPCTACSRGTRSSTRPSRG